MKASEGRLGRVFFLRLEHGDRIPECIERFAESQGITTGCALLVGGIRGGQVVVGPRVSDERPPEPLLLPVDGAHEIVGVGTIAPGANGKPELHMHASLGRAGHTLTGCVRPGVDTWLIGEVILYEILGTTATRKRDAESGFVLLDIQTPLDKPHPP